MGLNDSIYALLLLTGLAGSVGHCLGMCGPLVIMVGLHLRAGNSSSFAHQLLYHGSRISLYTVLGGAAGLFGSFAGSAGRLSTSGGALSIAFGAGVMFFGLVYLGWLPAARLKRLGAALKTAMSWALRRGDNLGVALLGALSGLLPCCLVYGSLLAAASTAAPLAGALGMFLFGAGTIPALLVVGMTAAVLGTRSQEALRRISGAAMVLVALQLEVRGLAEIGLLPHYALGNVVLW